MTASSFAIAVDQQLSSLPRLVLDARSIMVGPYTSASEYDSHIATTFGSGGTSGFGEAIRFGLESKLLASAWVHLPEQFAPIPTELADKLFSRPPMIGLPCAVDRVGHVEWPQALLIDPTGAFIAATIGQLQGTECRLQVACDFELILSDQIAGWLLRSPARYLSSDWFAAEPNDRWTSLSPILARFLTTVTTDLVIRLEEQDHAARTELERLRAAALQAEPSGQRSALVNAISNILEAFSSP